MQSFSIIIHLFNKKCVIPAITSRCLPLFFAPVETSDIILILKDILQKEGVLPGVVSDDDLEIIAEISKGDCRKAITYLQITVLNDGVLDSSEITGSETTDISTSLFSSLMRNELRKSCEIAEMLMIDYGLSGDEVIKELSKAARREYNDKRIAIALSDADYKLCSAGNEFIQINALLARIIAEVFN